MEANIQKAKESDWQNILVLLGEAGLREYLPNENFNENFYVLYEGENLVCTFVVDFENDIGVLKSFAVSKSVQGKGIGKKVANKMDFVAKDFKLSKLYATSWEAPEFWKKTIFKEINEDEASDIYFIKYVKDIKDRFPQYSPEMKHFLLTV